MQWIEDPDHRLKTLVDVRECRKLRRLASTPGESAGLSRRSTVTEAEPDFAALECVIERQQIRAALYEFPSGPVEGYQWRLLLRYPFEGDRTEWTPWVFGSTQSVDAMLTQWQEYLSTRGHLAKSIPPGSTAH